MNYAVTYHAQQRMQQRFEGVYSQLNEHLSFTAMVDVLLQEAQENKYFINNSQRMQYLYEHYGFERQYCFMEVKRLNMVLVFVKDVSEDKFSLATVVGHDFSQCTDVMLNQKKMHQELQQHQQQLEQEQELQAFQQYQHEMARHRQNIVRKNEEVKAMHRKYKHKAASDIVLKLKMLITEGQTEIIRKTPHYSLRKVVVDNKRYVFRYTSGVDIEIVKELDLNPGETIQTIGRLVRQGKTLVLEKISNSTTLREVIFGGKKYTFTYRGGIDIKIEKEEEYTGIFDASVKFLPFEEDTLPTTLIAMVQNEEAALVEKIAPTIALYRAQVNGVGYLYWFNLLGPSEYKVKLISREEQPEALLMAA